MSEKKEEKEIIAKNEAVESKTKENKKTNWKYPDDAGNKSIIWVFFLVLNCLFSRKSWKLCKMTKFYKEHTKI